LKRLNRLLIAVVLVAIVLTTWVLVFGAQSDSAKQATLIAQAAEYTRRGIFFDAAPLLEEAAGYDTARTAEVERLLKDVYLELIDKGGFRQKYIDLLGMQMRRPTATFEVFHELASFYFGGSRYEDAFDILKDGIARTGSDELVVLYEANRYIYRIGYNSYEDVTAISGSTIGVCNDELWGVATSKGELFIPCEYERISTFSAGRAFVQRSGEIFAVDSANNRRALLLWDEDGFPGQVSEFGNYANDRLTLKIDGKWYRATGSLVFRTKPFDWIGMHSDSHAAVIHEGKWGVIDLEANLVIPAEYDGIIMDELGRCYRQGAVFVRQGGAVHLLADGERVGDAYDDAKPFGVEGYAAVKKNGLWGFIDTSGEVVIPYQFEDAQSFGQHLAAVRVGEFWGYISLGGKIVIEPEFLQAKGFGNGSAPVLTERGWRFITLIQYMEGASL